ncbi:MAG: hypothetical protein LBV28_01180, partial [Puniceicoccales bacterium]|nr:hypothetical protein [Puniceicoccales bacterium]
MNKTASLIIRILALLAAIAAGVAWYHIYDNNIKVALEKTKWLTDDPEIKAGDKFTERIEVLDSKLKDLLNAKREEIKTLTTNLDAANATIAQRDQTIKERNATISQLETERADLIRRRDELTSQLQQAVAKSEQVQGELDR